MAVDKIAVPMREQSAQERIKNFNEVPLGYNEEEAIKEASRCMQCAKKPCIDGCPVRISSQVPDLIETLKIGKFYK